MSNHVHTKPEHAPAEVQEGRAWSYSCTSCGEAVMVGMREGKGTQALSTSTSSGSEADTKPSGTLEENRLAIFKIVSTHENPKCFMNRMCDGCNSKVQALLSLYQKELVTGDTSDGYHTFNELYEFRLLYNAALFNQWAEIGVHDVHKSYKHSDGELAFGGGWFVVVAQLPTGQITNHYENKDWDLFKVPVRDRAAQWDGHSAADVAKRLRGMIEQTRFEEVKATKPDLTGEQP